MTRIASRSALLLAAFLGIFAHASPARAQTAPAPKKALVYCPTSEAPAACDNIAAAIGAQFPGGVDRGYDGLSGTVDFASADLNHYTVVVIPSLADDADDAPYARLRDADVAARLKTVLTGRIAVWSGTPDQGDSNRDQKNVLLANLATWAGAEHDLTGVTGLVVLQDNSSDAAARYGWLSGVSPLSVTPDTTLGAYGSVQGLTAAGNTITKNGTSGQLEYTNMASYGLHLPQDATGVLAGALGGPANGPIVLVTFVGGGNGTATIVPDRGIGGDYSPGETVTFTGTGWAPGETVTWVLHEDPDIHENRTLSAVADESGKIFNNEFAPEAHDLGVEFTVIAVGETSGRSARTYFTDGNPNKIEFSTAAFARGVNSCSAAITVQLLKGSATETGGPTDVTLTSSSSGGSFHSSSNCNTNSAITKINIDATHSSGSFFYKDSKVGTPTLTAVGAGLSAGNAIATQIDTITAPTTSTVTSSLNPSTTGASVTLTATVVANPGTLGTPGGALNFKEGATLLSAATLNASGAATFTTTSLAAGSHTITAEYVGAGGFLASSGTVTQVVNPPGPTKLAFTTSAFTTKVGQCSPAISVQSQSNAGAAVNVLATTTVSLSSTNSTTGGFYSNSTCASGITSVSIAAGGNSASFFYKDASASAPTLTAAAVGLTTATQVETVQAAATTTAVSASPSPSSYQSAVTFTATVAPVAPGAGVPGGSVTFKDGATALGAAVALDATGKASISSSTLTAGSHTITAAYGGDANYVSSSGTASHIVRKAQATITLSDLEHDYDGTPKSPTAVTNPAGLTVKFAYGVGGLVTTNPTDAGTYPLIATIDDANYEGSETATFVINAVAPAVAWTAPAAPLTYGQTLSGVLNASATGVNGVALAGGTFTYKNAANAVVTSTTVLDAGTNQLLTVIFDPANTNYTSGTSSIYVDVNKASLSWAAEDATREYGEANPQFDGTLSGVVNNDGITASFDAPDATTTTAVGTYDIVAELADPNGRLVNYNVTAHKGTLSITPRNVALTITSTSREYGDPNPTFASAFAAGNVVGSDDVGCTLSAPTATSTSAAGSTHVIDAACTNTNYNVTVNTGTLTITKRHVTLTVANAGRQYGESNPTFGGSFASGDVLSGDDVGCTFDSSAPASADAGSTFDITAACTNANYDVAVTKGVLTILKRDVTVTAPNFTRVYGDPNPASFGTGTFAPALYNAADVSCTYTTTATAASSVVAAGYPITVGACTEPAGKDNYNFLTPVAGTLTVTLAPLTVVANSKEMFFGAASLPALDGVITGIKNGDNISATYATTATTASTVGSYPITPTLVDPSVRLGNYSVTSTNGTLKIVYYTGSGHAFLQPVNLGTQRSSFKLGSTIPVKFQIFLPGGAAVPGVVAHVSIARKDNTPDTYVNEPVYSTVPDQGDLFRYDTSGQLYIFNLGTKGLTAGSYLLTATLDDGSTISQQIEISSK